MNNHLSRFLRSQNYHNNYTQSFRMEQMVFTSSNIQITKMNKIKTLLKAR
jgi:hypothetical protein